MSFSANLKAAMAERRVTQTRLAELAGISKSSVSQYLSGKHEPVPAVALRLAEALDTSMDYLMHGEAAPREEGLKNVSVEQAARLLGKSQQFVRVSLQRGVAPFGFAVQVSGGRWSYHISPSQLNSYIGAAN